MTDIIHVVGILFMALFIVSFIAGFIMWLMKPRVVGGFTERNAPTVIGGANWSDRRDEW